MSEVRWLVDPYLEWAKGEGVPVHTGFGVDLVAAEVRPWPRYAVAGALVHVDGRGDFIDLQLLELAPGASTAPQGHLYEVVAFILSGRGSTTIEVAGGTRVVEWGPRSLVAIPLNALYRHTNAGREPARIAQITSLPVMLNLLRNERFLFANETAFPERVLEERFYKGEGRLLPVAPGRHQWETSFVPDLAAFELIEWKERGAGSKNMMFVLSDGTIHAHMSEMPVGTYKKAHRHTADFHIFPVTGEGYSVYWYEGDADFRRFDWKFGSVFAPADMMFHQHFNTSAVPTRYLAVAFGSLRYPFVEGKRKTWLGMDVSVKEGGRQIEYEDQDPRIAELYARELERRGIENKMRDAGEVGARR